MYWKPNSNFLVCVHCTTFNHSSYIEDAMNGFTMQQTTFPFVCVIIDDASTDGEQKVVKKYLQKYFDCDDTTVVRREETDDYTMTFAQHRENKNCYFAVYFLKYNHYSIKKSKKTYFSEWDDNAKYSALCEGDDYWIDALKLQKQTTIMEVDNNVVLVYTGFQLCGEVKKSDKNFYSKNQEVFSRSGDIFPFLLERNFIQTLTVCYRESAMNNSLYETCPTKMDYNLFLALASVGSVYYLRDKTSCYRINPEGFVRSRTVEVKKNVHVIRNFYVKSYLEGYVLKRQGYDEKIIYGNAAKLTPFNRNFPFQYWPISLFCNCISMMKSWVKLLLLKRE